MLVGKMQVHGNREEMTEEVSMNFGWVEWHVCHDVDVEKGKKLGLNPQVMEALAHGVTNVKNRG